MDENTFTIIEENDHKKLLIMNINDIDLCILNSLRRIIICEIPCIAFDFSHNNTGKKDIIIKENNTRLDNEYLSDRISLIPLNFNSEEIENFDNDAYKFVLEEKNEKAETLNITTSHFKIYDSNDRLMSDDFHSRIFPKNPITKDHILITKLKFNPYDYNKGEHIHIIAKASRNIGKTHSRWTCVSQSTCAYKCDEVLAKKEIDKRIAGKSKDEANKIKKKFDTLDKERYFIKNKWGEPSSFIFTIESICILKPRFIFKKAISVLIQKVELYVNSKKEYKKLDSSFYEIIINDNQFGITLVNVLQKMIYNNHFININNNKLITYIGYYQLHPQDSKILLRIRFIDDVNIDVHKFLNDECSVIINHLKMINTSFDNI